MIIRKVSKFVMVNKERDFAMNTDTEQHFRQADEFLREIEYLMAGGFYKASMGRAYYAMFHAATAAMLANEVDQGPRQAILPAFEKAFIKTNMLDKKFLNYFRQAFNARTEPETPSFGSADHRQAQVMLLRTREFITACRKPCE